MVGSGGERVQYRGRMGQSQGQSGQFEEVAQGALLGVAAALY